MFLDQKNQAVLSGLHDLERYSSDQKPKRYDLMHSGFVIDFDSSVLITDHHIAFIFVADVLQKSWYAQIRIHVFLLEIVANGVDISKFV